MLSNRKIRVLIVDDSVFLRLSLKKLFTQHADIEIVGSASNGREGINKLRELKPDVVVMDVEMPVINGMEALEQIMRDQPTPVIIFSSLTSAGAQTTMQAFSLGAVEVIAKPSSEPNSNLFRVFDEMVQKIKAAADIDVRKIQESLLNTGSANTGSANTASANTASANTGSANASPFNGDRTEKSPADRHPPKPRRTPGQNRSGNWAGAGASLIAIGISTGGPQALEKVLKGLPVDLAAPVVVAQHMPSGFTELLSKRLNSICPIEVREVTDGERLQKKTVYIAKSGRQLEISMRDTYFVAHVFEDNAELYKPSVDILFKSLAKLPAASRILGIIMTGMGNDGLQGARELKARGSAIMAESERSCIVYGMSRSVIEAGLADRVEDAADIAAAIIESVGRR